MKAYPFLSEVVADLLEDILRRFVLVWYDYISTSPEFLCEMRSSLRQGCSIFYERIHLAKWHVLVGQTLPKIMSQLSYFIEMSKSGAEAHEILAKLPSEDLHPALISFESEDGYLKCVLLKIAPYLFPQLSQTGAKVLRIGSISTKHLICLKSKITRIF